MFTLASLAIVGGIVLFPLLLNYTLGDSARIVRDSSLALYFAGGLLLGVHAAAEGFGRELRRGTAAAALAKPISRTLFFLAKTSGICAALLLFACAALLATLLAVRAGASDLRVDRAAALPALAALLAAPAAAGAWNRRTRRPFASASFFLLLLFLLAALAISACFPTPFDHLSFPRNFAWHVVPAGFLLLLCLGMAVSLSAALATRLAATPVLLVATGTFMAGLASDPLLGPRLPGSIAARAAYALLPNVQAFWLVEALDAAPAIPPAYFLAAAAYAAAWSTAVLALGCLSFHKLEIS